MTTTLLPRRQQIARLLGAISVIALATATAKAQDRMAAMTAPHPMAQPAAIVAVTAKNATVTIDHHMFVPTALQIVAGTTVTWKNVDDTPHTVRARNQTFASSGLDTGDSFSHTFATPGDYAYFCTLHPFMAGRIVVEPGRSP